MAKPFSFIVSVFALVFVLSAGASLADPTATQPPTADASPAPSPPKALSTAAAAKADLANTFSIIKKAQTLSYTSTVTMTNAPGAPANTVALSVSIVRPNLVRVELDQGGKIAGLVVSNGKECYAFDPAGNRYTKDDASSGTGVSAVAQALAPAAQIVDSTVAEAIFSPGLALFLDPSGFDLSSHPVPGSVYLSDLPDTIDGAAVSHINETLQSGANSVAIHLFVDKATGLPKRFAEDVTQNGKSVEVIREDFSKFDISAPSLDADNFSWTPPANAKLFKPASPQDQNKPGLATGAKAPDFTVLTTSDKPIHLSDYKGKVVVLDFWATWCGPCQMSLPHTDSLAKLYNAKGVVFLPVCTSDDKTAFRQWVLKHKSMSMKFYFDPAARDAGSSFANKLYGVQVIPTQFVIGKDGKVAQVFVGYDSQGDPQEKTLQQALDKAISAS